MKTDHVKMHSFGINRVVAERAGGRAGRVSHGLLQ